MPTASGCRGLRFFPLVFKPGSTLFLAQAGNHGIGVAWASANPSFGGPVPCHVYLSGSVPEASARKIASYKATVHRVDGTYEVPPPCRPAGCGLVSFRAVA